MKARRAPFEMHFRERRPETTKRLRIRQPFDHKELVAATGLALATCSVTGRRSDCGSKRTVTRLSKVSAKTIHTSAAKLRQQCFVWTDSQSKGSRKRRIFNPPFKQRVDVSPLSYWCGVPGGIWTRVCAVKGRWYVVSRCNYKAPVAP